ncbi:hypothetical protein D3C73_1445110 [compost metagenome]
MPLTSLICGIRSGGTSSTKSISPPRKAFTAVWESEMLTSSIRSTMATLPPAKPLAGSLRGT